MNIECKVIGNKGVIKVIEQTIDHGIISKNKYNYTIYDKNGNELYNGKSNEFEIDKIENYIIKIKKDVKMDYLFPSETINSYKFLKKNGIEEKIIIFETGRLIRLNNIDDIGGSPEII